MDSSGQGGRVERLSVGLLDAVFPRLRVGRLESLLRLFGVHYECRGVALGDRQPVLRIERPDRRLRHAVAIGQHGVRRRRRRRIELDPRLDEDECLVVALRRLEQLRLQLSLLGQLGLLRHLQLPLGAALGRRLHERQPRHHQHQQHRGGMDEEG